MDKLKYMSDWCVKQREAAQAHIELADSIDMSGQNRFDQALNLMKDEGEWLKIIANPESCRKREERGECEETCLIEEILSGEM